MPAFTDHSGAIATADTSQAVMDGNPARRLFFFQNVSDTEMWLGFNEAAVKDEPSIKVAAGATLTFFAPACPISAVTVICSANTKKFVAKQL